MESKRRNIKSPAPSMGSNHGERAGGPSSAPKRKTSLSLFEDLLENPNRKNLRPTANPEHHNNVKDSNVSDSKRRDEAAANERSSWISVGFITIPDNDMVYQNIERNLVSGLNSGGFCTHVEAIYRNGYSSLTSRAKLQSFGVYSKAVEDKCGGDPNVTHAWYGACKNEIIEILAHGFGLPLNNGVYGRGFYLSPSNHPLESFGSSSADADGLRYMLLCRVILGKVEAIAPGSPLHNPSSEEFDSAVDNLSCPKKYIIWTTKMNTHVLPEYVVSFRAISHRLGIRENVIGTSHWIPVATLINGLSSFLPGHAMKLLVMYHNDYQKKKITRYVMIQRMRLVAGDRLLLAIIRSFGEKEEQH